MAIAVVATRNALVATYIAQGSWISLHTSDPGTTGVGEATGGTPVYARKQTVWPVASNGGSVGTVVTFDVPAGTYTYAGLWTAQAGGTYIDRIAITTTTLGAQGQITVQPTYIQS